jgi:lysophospholipase L1-like esterase
MHAFFDPFCHPMNKPVAKGSSVPLALFRGPISFPIDGMQFYASADAAYTDAGTTLATTLGQTVRQVNDTIGSNHATQATAGDRPVYVPLCALSGKPAIRTALGTRHLLLPSVSINSQNFSFVAIIRPVQCGQSTMGLFTLGATDSILNGPTAYFASGTLTCFQAGGAFGATPTTQFVYGNPLVLVITGSASAINTYVNNTKSSIAKFEAQTGTGGLLGLRADGFHWQNLDVYEFGTKTGVLSDAEVAQIVTYAQEKYGVRTAWDNLVAFSGDSLTEGYADDGLGLSIPMLVGNAKGASWKLANASRTAQTMQTIEDLATYGLDRQVAGVSGTKHAICLGGTNDLGIAGVTGDGVSNTTLQTRVTNWSANRKTAGYNTTYVATLAKRGSLAWNSTCEGYRVAYNSWVRANEGVLFDYAIDIDANAAFDDFTDPTYYDADQLHWTQAGRQVVADLILDALT